MILVRDVFQAKYGKGDELVALFKEFGEISDWGSGQRLLTDLSGEFFTVVTETEVESLAEFERLRDEEFGKPEFADWFARMMPLVESGRREFYTIVEST